MTDIPSKTMPVAAICNGTVIDHITAGQALKIVHLLKLTEPQYLVTLGLNLPSKTLKYKDLIKVEGRELSSVEANQVAIFAPKSTISIINNYVIVKKFQVELPSFVQDIFSCPNPKCICNYEKISTVFFITPRYNLIQLQCKFCRKSFSQHDILIYKH
jgi:aspartate carbamoyltransferase regulatory subunit